MDTSLLVDLQFSLLLKIFISITSAVRKVQNLIKRLYQTYFCKIIFNSDIEIQ